jgi:hypothetical protein
VAGLPRASRATTANSGWPWKRMAFVAKHRLVVLVRRGDVVEAGNVGSRQHRDDAGRCPHGRRGRPTGYPMRDGREAEAGVQRAQPARDVVDIECGGTGDVLFGAESCFSGERRSGRRRHGVETGSNASAMGGLRQQCRRRGSRSAGAGGFDEEAAQQVPATSEPVGGRGPHVGERLEVLREAGDCAAAIAASFQAFPSKAASAALARFGVPAMPP